MYTSWSCTHSPSSSLALKTLPWKPRGRLVVWAWAVHTPCLESCNKCCPFLHHNPKSVDWLCCALGKWPKFGLVTVPWRIDLRKNEVRYMKVRETLPGIWLRLRNILAAFCCIRRPKPRWWPEEAEGENSRLDSSWELGWVTTTVLFPASCHWLKSRRRKVLNTWTYCHIFCYVCPYSHLKTKVLALVSQKGNRVECRSSFIQFFTLGFKSQSLKKKKF